MKKYLIVACEPYNGETDELLKTPLRIVESYKKTEVDECEVYEIKKDGTLKLIKKYDEYSDSGYALIDMNDSDDYYDWTIIEKVSFDISSKNRSCFVNTSSFKKWIKNFIEEDDDYYSKESLIREFKNSGNIASEYSTLGIVIYEGNKLSCPY